MDYRYTTNCVNCDRNFMDDLHHIIDNSKQITRKTFRTHVNLEELGWLEEDLGYVHDSRNGLTMKDDWHVTYHKSKMINGNIVYYLQQSGIEHIFTKTPLSF